MSPLLMQLSRAATELAEEEAGPTTRELIQPFCSTDQYRNELQQPWSYRHYSYATDGKIMVRVKRDDSIPEMPHSEFYDHYKKKAVKRPPVVPPQAEKMFRGFPKTGFRYIEIPSRKELYAKQALTSVRLRDRYINWEYLNKIMKLPNAQVHWEKGKATEALHFIFEGGRGLVMPMRPYDGDAKKIVIQIKPVA